MKILIRSKGLFVILAASLQLMSCGGGGGSSEPLALESRALVLRRTGR